MSLGKGLAELFLVLGRQVLKPIDFVGLVKVGLDVLELLRRDTAIVTPGEGRVAVCDWDNQGSKSVITSRHKGSEWPERQNGCRVHDGRPCTLRHSGDLLITTWVPKRNEPCVSPASQGPRCDQLLCTKGLETTQGVLTLGILLPLQGLGPLHLLVPSSDHRDGSIPSQRAIDGMQ